ncbi:MAG: type II secretion system major pseudopilin GspG [Phycisphaerae bacterium]|nr:type II secretion system major pseudopilin GspG [Phycisphaerae bacterium]
MLKRSHNNRKAFTMIEIIAVLVIVGLLATVATTTFMGKIEKAKVDTTKANLKQLSSAVMSFKMSTGRYPEEEEGLDVLVNEPTDAEGWDPEGYLMTDDVPKDGWNNEFYFQRYTESGKPFVIISYGADGEEGGEGYDADLYSTDAD